jgi:hypothetical protein
MKKRECRVHVVKRHMADPWNRLRPFIFRGSARCASQIHDRGAQSVARGTARGASHISLAVASLCIAGS